MAMTISGITRTVALWLMIISVAIADFFLYLRQEFWWASFWSAVIILVIIYEVLCYVFHRKTISTRYKDFIISNPFWGYTILFLLWLALNSLVLHLAVF